MTEKELKKLNRAELLQMLLIQTERVEQLEEELKEMELKHQTKIKKLENALEDKRIKIENIGSIAEASLALNGVFEAAQKAADQYLENVISLYKNVETLKLEDEHEQEI